MLVVLLIVVAAWIGLGCLLLILQSRPAGADYRRRADRRVYSVGETVEVEMSLIPPFEERSSQDHDVLLVLDHSGSMGAGPGSPLVEAVRAAENFVRCCPGQMHLGVIEFDDQANTLCPIAGEHRRALQALGTIGSGGGTAIHAALEEARQALHTGRQGVKKSVILLSDGGSDRQAALQAAELLKNDLQSPQVLCVGLGQVDEELLCSIASKKEYFRHISKPEELMDLFEFLAAVVSGQMAVAGIVDEGARSPCPFQLKAIGGLHPVGLHRGQEVRIVWSVPLMKLEPMALTYKLVPECPGWHPVASPDSKADWKMPSGAVRQIEGPVGPRVLVLPELLAWAWPLLNPLFWLILGRFFCRQGAPKQKKAPQTEPLPEAALPDPLPAPAERDYIPQLRPALIVGLGKTGQLSLQILRQQLNDRGIEPEQVQLLSLSAVHSLNRFADWNGKGLAAGERVDLHQDLRPYLEQLRRSGAPPSRSWIPFQQWLAEKPPLTTQYTVSDRRKARLTLLLRPHEAEKKLSEAVRRIRQQDGMIVLTGALDDREFTGMAAEAAHICAANGAGVTLLAPRLQDREADREGLLAFVQETERMILMRGAKVLSDRRSPPVAAHRLFDRILLIENLSATVDQAAKKSADLLWHLLAYERLLQELGVSDPRGGKAFCCRLSIDCCHLPSQGIWQWVKAKALSEKLNRQWMGLRHKQGRLRLQEVAEQKVQHCTEVFWSGDEIARPRGLLLTHARSILASRNPVAAFFSLADRLPAEGLYHDQVEFRQQELQAFHAYCEEWCLWVLEQEKEGKAWGLLEILQALLRVEDGLQAIQDEIQKMSGSQDFKSLTQLAASLYQDLSYAIGALRKETARWIGKMAGADVALGVECFEENQLPVCTRIEQMRADLGQRPLFPNQAVEEMAEEWCQQWIGEYGDDLLQQIGFEVICCPGGIALRLRAYQRRLGLEEDVTEALSQELDLYANLVLAWPLHKGLEPGSVSDTFHALRAGKHSSEIFPKVTKVLEEEDPHLASALTIRRVSLAEAVSASELPAHDPPYVWPEEANARRISERIRNLLQREPRPFGPALTQLLRDTRRLYAFLADLAQGRLKERGAQWILEREGRSFRVGEAAGGHSDEEAMHKFQSVLRQVVAAGASTDGHEIPHSSPRWEADAEEAVRQVEAHPIACAALSSPDWLAWRDAIRGLVLEHGQ